MNPAGDYCNDEQLAARLSTGDHQAFTLIYDRYWAPLYVHARKMLGNEEEAMDVVQDIFTVLWTRSSDLTIHSSLKAYLYTAVRNRTLNAINKGRLRDSYLQSLTGFMEQGRCYTDEQVCYRDFANRIEQEIAALPPKMQLIFTMSRESGLSNKAIAEQLNVTDRTVKKTIHRAIKALRIRTALFIMLMIFVAYW